MQGFRRLCRMLILPVAVLFAMSTMLPSMAVASMVATDSVVETQATAENRAKVNAFLEREDVRAELEAFGVDAKEAQERVAGLSDDEIAQIAGHLHAEPAGEGVLGTIVGVALILFLVFAITDVLGATNVFPFISPVR